jgi:hypothetical protein
MDWTFGPKIYLPEFIQLRQKCNVAITHDFHFNNRLPTYEATVTSCEGIRVVDWGHLTVFDDPEVPAIASKYGDPEPSRSGRDSGIAAMNKEAVEREELSGDMFVYLALQDIKK